ncbi:Planctomycete cytochrome C [Pirellulimonas nuda]|uniref:Planctomycete cytochrome C n=1 Tax=Pirellulimonas nuda TaxID=2528009 RepID=A0A518DAT8_9BACT|nr:c-type cytochrome domain-containing protein [Pirellulimonas nuda]QDU88595.1 Planctomycete cytochrome C [Pirellulimonas nuda]
MSRLLQALAVASLLAAPTLADNASENRNDLRRFSTQARAAERFAAAGRGDDAVAAFEELQKLVAGVAERGVDPRSESAFKRAMDRLTEFHGELTAAGFNPPPLAKIAPATPPAGGGDGDVSFTSQVAPMLAARCGGCHVDGSRGGFSLATYSALMRGADPGGTVLVPGDGAGSLIVELIVSGDMPRGGGRVTPAETQMLVSWINQGARFDGADASANLRDLKPGQGAPMQPKPASPPMKVTRPKGGETVSFAIDVAPIIDAKCRNCHGAGQQQGGLDMGSFAALLKGGDGGPVIAGGKPDESPLLRRVRGDDPPQMPLRQTPLSAQEIETIATWIREGASFDGKDAATGLALLIATERADRFSGPQLSKFRSADAADRWRLAVPDEPARQLETPRFLVIGNANDDLRDRTGAALEGAADDVLSYFRQPPDGLGKARVTAFVFDGAIDYGEFGLMVEKRQLPATQRRHWRHDALTPYLCVVPAAADDDLLRAELAQQVAALYLSARTSGELPGWLAEGAARAVRAKLYPRDPEVAEWEGKVPELAARMPSPDAFMTGRIDPQVGGVVAYGFAGAMLRGSSFNKLLDAMAAGKPFAEAFQGVYRVTPKQAAESWQKSVAAKRGR